MIFKAVTAIGNSLSSPFLLLIRLYWGCGFVLTGFGKLAHLNTVAAYFQSLGIPLPYLNGLLVGSTELIGGALLLLGLYSRIAAIPLFCVLCGAYLTASREALHALFAQLDPTLFFKETAFLFLYAVVIIFIFGPGKISCDYWMTIDGKRQK